MFGGGGSRGQRQTNYKGQDFSSELTLHLRDVFITHKQTLTVNGKSIRVTIPAGIEDGKTIRIKRYGGDGMQGGPKGDLLITIKISNDTKFKRVQSNLHTDFDLNLYTAILGGYITVDTFDGKVKVKVKPGTPVGTKVRLKGKGFSRYKKEGMFGDLIITYQVTIPTKLSEQGTKLFNELANLQSNGND
jgi:curved DNA-binding protein